MASKKSPPWDPDDAGATHDPRFTEHDPHFNDLYGQAQKAQFNLAELEGMSTADLSYLAGHHERPPDITDARWSKLTYNAHRAEAVLQRKWADDQLRKNRWLAGVALVISGLSLLVSVAAVLEDDGDRAPDLAPVTTTVP